MFVYWYASVYRGISHDALLSHLHMLDHHSALYVLHCLTPLARFEEHKVLELLQRTGIKTLQAILKFTEIYLSFADVSSVCRRSFTSGLPQQLSPEERHSVSRFLCYEVCLVCHQCERKHTHTHRLPGLWASASAADRGGSRWRDSWRWL